MVIKNKEVRRPPYFYLINQYFLEQIAQTIAQ